MPLLALATTTTVAHRVMADQLQNCSSSRRKPGPERSSERMAMDFAGVCAETSARTTATYLRAWRLANAYGIDFRAVLTRAIRPNGSVNVTRLYEMTCAEIAYLGDHDQ